MEGKVRVPIEKLAIKLKSKEDMYERFVKDSKFSFGQQLHCFSVLFPPFKKKMSGWIPQTNSLGREEGKNSQAMW